MADAIRRAHARIPCDLPVEIHMGAAAGRLQGKGRMLNVSLSGAFISFEGDLQRGTPYRLRVAAPEGTVDFPCRVAREGPRVPQAPGTRQYGILFNLTAAQERQLRQLVDAARRQPPTEKETGLDKSLRDYWSS